MGMTIAGKIIVAAAGVESMKPGDIHTVNLNCLMSNDGITHPTINMYRSQLKRPRITDALKLIFIADHNAPASNPKTAVSQKKIRDSARENGIDFWEGKGVYYQIMMEHYARPGELIFGADGHTCTYGALGTFGTDAGCMDYLHGMVTGASWTLVSEIMKSNLVGKLRPGVYPKDLMLTIIGQVGASEYNYQVMEFTGRDVKTLNVNDRMILCNLAVEVGARMGIVEADEVALEHLEEHSRAPKAIYHSNEDAVYMREYIFDLSKTKPVAVRPDFVDDVVPASGAAGTATDEAFLGSCNNGRVDDLWVGAVVTKGKKVAEHVGFPVVLASDDVYQQAPKEELIEIFMEAGVIVMNANCSVCQGSCQDVIGENEVLINTGTRNFKRRAGHPSSKAYLASVMTVAASTAADVTTMANQLM